MNAPAVMILLSIFQAASGFRLARRMDKPTDCQMDLLHIPKAVKCRMAGGSACPLSSMRAEKPNMVYPGGKTRCLEGLFPDFAFQVIPGRRDKLILAFDGGGACWDRLSYMANSCSKKVVLPYTRDGIFSQAPENPFRDHSTVIVQYCSGDLHSGNVTHSWRDQLSRPVHQFGYHNTRATVDWVKANFPDRLQSFVITGSSAGGIGAQVWASTLLREFDYERASVIADSYVGAFPPGFEGPVFNNLGVCGLDIIRPELKDSCHKGSITIADVFDFAMAEFPNVAFASIQSKYEEVQHSFWNKAALSMGRVELSASPESFFSEVRGILARYNRRANFVSCIVPLAHHTFQFCNELRNLPVGGGYGNVLGWEAQFAATAPNSSFHSVCTDSLNESSTFQCDPALTTKVFSPPL